MLLARVQVSRTPPQSALVSAVPGQAPVLGWWLLLSTPAAIRRGGEGQGGAGREGGEGHVSVHQRRHKQAPKLDTHTNALVIAAAAVASSCF